MGIQLTLRAKIDVGQEVVLCREIALPGDAGIEVTRLEHESNPGTHHVHAFRTNEPPNEVSPGVFPCGNLAGPLFYTAQGEKDSLTFPEGVGVKLDRGQIIRLELHYLNTTDAVVDADLRFNLWFAKSPLTTEAGSFYMYDHDIAVPAHGSATTRMHCEIPRDILITSLLPHVHAHGTGERIYLTDAGQGAPRLLVASKGFGNLETRIFDAAPIVVKAGQSLDFECDFANTLDHGIISGTSTTTAEMCMILGTYFPRLPVDAEWCTSPGSGPLHEGTQTCQEALSCADSAGEDDDFAKEQCAVDVCAGSSRAIDAFRNCSFTACPKDCPGNQCSACAQEKCHAEHVACLGATCGN